MWPLTEEPDNEAGELRVSESASAFASTEGYCYYSCCRVGQLHYQPNRAN